MDTLSLEEKTEGKMLKAVEGQVQLASLALRRLSEAGLMQELNPWPLPRSLTS
jgi:hypothetical protein